MKVLKGPSYGPLSFEKPLNALILLHGVGADGDNLIGLGDFMARDFPDTIFISPNAPFEFDMFSSGYQWFSLAERTPEKMLEGVRKVEPIVNQFIDEVIAEYQLKDANVGLLGFSQGTMTALHVAARRKNKLAAVVGFSGALIAPELLSQEVKQRPDICLIHGEEDDVVPFSAMGAAEAALSKNGFYVEAHSREYLPHSIDPKGIQIATNFLKTRI